MKTGFIILGIFAAIVLITWLGLRIKPAAFPAFAARPLADRPSAAPQTMPLPAGLPAPVERYYRQLYGDQVPVIETAVLSGRGTMAPFGLPMPMRFRFIYEVGKDYRAQIEAAFFGQAVMKATETYIDGHALGHMPFGVDEGPWLDDSMNIRVYTELLTWFPAALLNDPRVRWDAVDDEMALLVVPFGDKEQRAVVRFDPQTGKLAYLEVMRYRKAGDRMLWINAVWFDQGKPWISLDVEDQVFNVEVAEAIRGE